MILWQVIDKWLCMLFLNKRYAQVLDEWSLEQVLSEQLHPRVLN